MELLAVYIYPAQVFFCKQPLTRLQELVGRRVRVSSIGQADFVGALGATPVNTAFSQIAASLQAGETDCAITGALSGHTLGLYRVTQYLYPLPVSWGVALFAANREVGKACLLICASSCASTCRACKRPSGRTPRRPFHPGPGVQQRRTLVPVG